MGESVNASKKLILKGIPKTATFFDVVDGLMGAGEM